MNFRVRINFGPKSHEVSLKVLFVVRKEHSDVFTGLFLYLNH